MLATVGSDGFVRFWSLEGNDTFVEMKHSATTSGVVQSSHADWMLTSSWRGAFVWSAKLHFPDMTLTTDDVRAAALSSDGRIAAVAEYGGIARTWNTADWSPLVQTTRSKEPLNAVALSSTGRWLVIGGGDKQAHIWDLANGKEVAVLPHPESVEAALFGPGDHDVIVGSSSEVVGGSNTKVQVWDWKNQKVEAALDHSDVTAMAISPDGNYLATGGSDTIRVWTMKNFQPVTTLSYSSSIRALAFSWDGKWLASGGSEHTVRLWNTHTWQEDARLTEPSAVLSIAFARDGRRLEVATGSAIRLEWFWPADLMEKACSLLPRNLSESEWKEYIGGVRRKTCYNLPLERESTKP
jgi:WD40 repeat protein